MRPDSLFRIILLFNLLFALGCQKYTPSQRDIINFGKDWRFHLGDAEGAEMAGFNDQRWRILDVPHDWSIEGEFSRDHPATPGGGALPGGIGWYRKSFTLTEEDREKQIFIDFDGVYQRSEVWINGNFLGMRPNGYISFRYDLTPYLRFGSGENVIAVKVNNQDQPNSRWYSGSGIYRNVWLVKTGRVHVSHWGTYITTPEVTSEKAEVKIETRLSGGYEASARAVLRTTLYDPAGKRLGNAESPVTITSGNQNLVVQQITVAKPRLWDIDDPQLYKAVSEVFAGDVLTDTYETTFGIRYFKFDPEEGFFLNGRPVKILGVCQHHDLGSLGAAVNVRALERQLEILREMGCNSIRTSHNPPAPELLQLCDRMGFIVQNETFDMWRKRKTAFDYSMYFPEWHERDLTDHILRDRNHASVFMWSIGNEVLEQWEHVNADTLDIRQANLLLNFEKNVDPALISSETMSVNSLLTIKLANMVRELDPTRPVTAGCNEVNPWNNLFKSGALDIYGFNYHHQNFANFHDTYPGKSLLVSESTSGLMTRGFYQMPSDSIYIWPHRGQNRNMSFGNPEQQCSAYDNCHVPWGSTHEESWRIVRNHKHIAGTYIWTGFDYLGEPTPYWWPSRSSYFGIIDLAGFPKDVFYMYQSEWTDKDVLHIFPHWNWSPGDSVDVWAYSSAPEVELFLNGKSLGVQQKGADDLHLRWRVAWSPGTIKAVSRSNGKEKKTREITTAGEPAAIRLTADRSKLSADGQDLSFVTVEILDKDGNVVPAANNLVNFELDGQASIAGVDNGNPVSHEPFQAYYRKAFNGKCLAIVKAPYEKGSTLLKATSEGLKPAELKVIYN
jgi:beta-galactosidase